MLNCKTPRRSLRQLNETRRRIKKFYNYRSQSAAHPFSFKIFLKKFGAIAVVSFSMQVVWIYLSQRRGGGGGQRHQHNISPVIRLRFHTEFIC